ncbi:MAG: tetratricopeptide repeat protein [Pseudomonadota bacterium]
MSIINQMLRDLDARHASANERSGLPSNLRTLPPEQAPRSKTWLLLVVGLFAGALIAWLVVSQPAAIPVAPPPVAALPSVPSVAQPQSQPQPAPPPPAPVPESPPPPVPKPAPVVKAPAPVSAPAVKPIDKPADKPAKPVVPQAVVAVPAGEGQIDKQPKGGMSREQAEPEYRKGMQAAGIGDYGAALPALRRALEIDPMHAKARQALLSVLASSRQWDEVKQVARSGLALDPARTGWASILARLQHEQGDTEGAVKTLETYAAHAAGDADYQGLFAFLLQKQKRYAEAAQRYQAALGLRPGEGRWWFGLGLALEGAGHGDEAKAAFGKARDAGNLPADMLGIIEQKLR